MNKVQEATKEFLKDDIPEFGSGDTLSIDVKVKEGNKERIQKYEGVVVARHGGVSLDASFTVRKVANGVGVERIFPLHSPLIESIDVKRRGKVRRAKLNYLKNVTGSKAARIEEKDNLISSYPAIKKYIRRFVGAIDFIRGKQRWCLWITNNEGFEETKKIL